MPSRVAHVGLALALLACARSTEHAGVHDAFVTRDASRPQHDAGVGLPDAWLPAPDASDWPCTTLGPIAPRPGAVLGASDQRITVRASATSATTVEVCTEPTCEAPVRSLDVRAPTVVVEPPLPDGHYFWRARDTTQGVTPPWPFAISSTGPPRAGTRPLDVSGDGLADVVLVESSSGAPPWSQVDVRIGVMVVAPSGIAPRAVPDALVRHGGDLDADGSSDLVIPHGGGFPTILYGDVCAPLAGRETAFANGSFEVDVIGDVDGDHFDDMLAVNVTETPSVYAPRVLYGGPAAASETLLFDPVLGIDSFSDLPYAALGVDWSGDGLPDFAIGVPSSNVVLVYSGARGASTSPFETIAGEPGSRLADTLAAGDVDGDGDVELVASIRSLAGFTVIEATGARSAWIDAAAFPWFRELLALGDFDLDGADDFALASDVQLVILWGGATPTLVTLTDCSGCWLAAPGDVDGDGAPDLVSISRSDEVVVHRGGERYPRDLARFVVTGAESVGLVR